MLAERRRVVALTAPGIEDCPPGKTLLRLIAESLAKRRIIAFFEEVPTRLHHESVVTVDRPPDVLRQQEVDVAAPRDIEAVTARTDV